MKREKGERESEWEHLEHKKREKEWENEVKKERNIQDVRARSADFEKKLKTENIPLNQVYQCISERA